MVGIHSFVRLLPPQLAALAPRSTTTEPEGDSFNALKDSPEVVDTDQHGKYFSKPQMKPNKTKALERAKLENLQTRLSNLKGYEKDWKARLSGLEKRNCILTSTIETICHTLHRNTSTSSNSKKRSLESKESNELYIVKRPKLLQAPSETTTGLYYDESRLDPLEPSSTRKTCHPSNSAELAIPTVFSVIRASEPHHHYHHPHPHLLHDLYCQSIYPKPSPHIQTKLLSVKNINYVLKRYLISQDLWMAILWVATWIKYLRCFFTLSVFIVTVMHPSQNQ